MAYAEASIVVEKPISEVFPFVLDGENNKLWRPSVMEVKRNTNQPIGVGTIFIQNMKGPGGKTIPADYQILECIPEQKFSFQVIKGPYRPIGTFSFEPQGRGVKITFSFRFTPKGLFRLLDPMLNGHFKKVAASVEGLKNVWK